MVLTAARRAGTHPRDPAPVRDINDIPSSGARAHDRLVEREQAAAATVEVRLNPQKRGAVLIGLSQRRRNTHRPSFAPLSPARFAPHTVAVGRSMGVPYGL